MSLFLRFTLLLLALNVLSSWAYDSYGGRGYSGKYVGGKPVKNPMFTQSVPGQTARRGLGISAWGIVVIIIAIILGGMGFYYFSMCYPILCKKKKINGLKKDYSLIHVDTDPV